MSATTAILALVLYPLLYGLPFNWIRFYWGYRHGLAPMPTEIAEKAQAADRAVLLCVHGTLLGIVIFMLRGSSISTDSVGLSLNNWKSALALGVLLSLYPLGVSALVRRILTRDELQQDPKSHGSVIEWFALILLGSISHELWRAFCIVGLMGLDLTPLGAVLIAAGAYGALQLYKNIGAALGSATYGVVAGLLFVKTGSLLAPLAMYLIASGVDLYQFRRALSRAQISSVVFKCPKCSQVIERPQKPPGGWFPCPGCGEKLRIGLRDWALRVSGISCALLTLLILVLLHIGVVWSLVLFLPLLFFLLFVSSSVLTTFVPELLRAQTRRDPYRPPLFRF
jgi:hypothetical protein